MTKLVTYLMDEIKIMWENEKEILEQLEEVKKTNQKLRTLGIRKVADVQQMPLDIVQKVFGKMGDQLCKRANGIDNSPIVVFNERKSISNERTFENDTIDVAKLKTIRTAMTENLAYQLRRGKKLTACVSVKIRYSDFNTYSKQIC